MIYGIYVFWTEGTPETQKFAKGFAVMAIWVSILLSQMPFRLKNIETNEKGIFIKDFRKKIFVEYRDLQWISKYDLTSPWAVTIKYRDRNMGIDKKVSFWPSQSDQRLLGSDAMTKYIHDMIVTHNPGYSKKDQPSQIKNILITTLLGLPFFLIFLYLSGFLELFFQK